MTKFYSKAFNILTSKEKFHIELGLDRIKRVLSLLDNPQDKLTVIHVAGTNGKGSVCALINEFLIKSGFKTGLYTSPHITKYTERIKINNKKIPEEDFCTILEEINETCKTNNIYLTEFEMLTVAAFLWFSRQKTDYVVLEVGLGGRLDATNVINKPVLSIITSISLDHTDRLGNTTEKIAREKAGIIKKDTPVIVSKNNAGLKTIMNIAQKHNAQVIIPYDVIKIKQNNLKTIAEINGKDYEFSLYGTYQSANLSLALKAAKVLKLKEPAIKKALKSVKHTARFEIINGKNLVIDGAHNPDGAKALRNAINNIFPDKPVIFIYATLDTKDYKSVLNNLLYKKDEIIFLDFHRQNSVAPDTLAKFTNKTLRIIKNAKEIIQIAKSTQNPVVITGSLYAIGTIYKNLKNKINQSDNFK